MTDLGIGGPVHFTCFRIITVQFPPCRQGNTAMSEVGVSDASFSGPFDSVFLLECRQAREMRFRVEC